jgi:pimeloyl-ACP methyl ester carboxylesterase
MEACTLVLADSEPPPDPAKATRRAAGAIPGARTRVPDDHGHMAHKINPILLADLVRTLVSTGVLA